MRPIFKMSAIFNSYLLIFFSRFWCLCYGFVLLSTATGTGGLSQLKTFEPGSAWIYDLQTSVLLNEKEEKDKDIGFLVSGSIRVESVWSDSHLDRLLRFVFTSPKLNIRSNKVVTPDGFVSHTSNLETFPNSEFLAHWSKGKIQKILVQKDEPLSLVNFKKGIVSLFQFQVVDQETNEIDASGRCKVTYKYRRPNQFTKTKLDCISTNSSPIDVDRSILSTELNSLRKGTYTMNEGGYIESVKFEERHVMFAKAKEDMGNKIESRQTLTLRETKDANILVGKTFEEVVDHIVAKEKLEFIQESLEIETENSITEEEETFQAAVKASRSNLKSHILGTLPSVKTVAKLVSLGRTSTSEDIAKTLGVKKNQAVLHQLYDILGYVQTKASHGAAMKKLKFDDKKMADLSERYLWSLSMSSRPNFNIISDLLTRYVKVKLPKAVEETFLLTLATMAKKLRNLPSFHEHSKIYEDVQEAILNGLNRAKGENRLMYLRALKNLESSSTIPKLLNVMEKATSKERVLAWKAVRSFDPTQWNGDVLKMAHVTFFQLDKKYDSSSRTLALDVILQAKPTDDVLKDLVYFLLVKCKSPEVQQYLMQKLHMIGEENEEFARKIRKIITSDSQLNNYQVLADRGLSTALKRNFLQSSGINGSLVAIQEIENGIVKRGIVDVVLEKNKVKQEMFTLGIFSGGLNSFIGGGDAAATESDETATAGIELTVLGTQIRPFVFFNGQGELMGHVWSGTASEKTTAYQALLLLQDYRQQLHLGSGFIADLDLMGAASFDLSGKIGISIWNRNAESVVEKSASIIVTGSTKIHTEFIKSQIEFNWSVEPKFNLETNIDFYSNISLCMRLSQPDFVFRYNIFKIERIPGSKHRLRKVKYGKQVLPGQTYSLNKKNNEMCSAILNK